jgi:hypothetical protein
MSHLLRKAAQNGDLAKARERLEAGDDIEARDKGTGRTALLEAVIAGQSEIVRYLLGEGADMNAVCKAVGYDGLGWAAEQGDAELVRLFLEKGADPNRVTGAILHRLPLMTAAQRGHLAVVKLLIESGANPALRDKQGDTAFSLAEARNRQEVVRFLRTVLGANPPPLPTPALIPWPKAEWEEPAPLYGEGEAVPIPPDAPPAQIARAFILAMNRWESDAHESQRDMGDAMRAVRAIRDAYCTDRKRMGHAGYGFPPDFELSLAMVSETRPRAGRCEIMAIITDKQSVQAMYEYCFVLLRKGGVWRIDSVKKRVKGAEKWDSMIL